MRARDFLILVLVCLVWAFSNVLGKIAVDRWDIPPIFFTAARFVLVALCTLPWLRPVPRPLWRILLIGLCMGGGNFALLYMGLQGASPSAAAVVLQLAVPFTALLAVLMLKETIRWRRGLGIALTMAGVLLVSWNPAGLGLAPALWFVVGAAFSAALGSVLMKQMESVPPLRFQAWVGLISAFVLSGLSLMFESGQVETAMAAGWRFVGAVVFMALIVSICGHTAFYGLIKRYEANLLAPLTLMTPLATIGFGVWLTGDQLSLRMIIGAAIALGGVLIVAIRPKPTAEMMLNRETP
ncbi:MULTISPECIES: DMT family transporter [unclassified Brevundimonas]|uniref:DMT family transporter n=1 Tax=unclassified Brevundimonas TaxID=2622653 RepID=UPI0025B82F7D|nr:MULTISPECIES: DMT family transporter [unclassified Brevundimonas]